MPIARSKVLQVLSSTKKLRDSHLLPFPMWISGYPFPTLWSILQRLKANCSHVRIDLCLPLQKNQASLDERHQSKTAFYPHGAWDHMGSSQNRSMMSIGCVPKLVHDVSVLKTTSNVGSHWQIKQGNCDWGTLNQRHTGKQRVDDRRNTENVEQSRRLSDTIFASLAHFAQLSLSDHSTTTQSLGPKHHHTLPTKPTAAHLIAGQQVDPAQSTELFAKWCEISTMESGFQWLLHGSNFCIIQPRDSHKLQFFQIQVSWQLDQTTNWSNKQMSETDSNQSSQVKQSPCKLWAAQMDQYSSRGYPCPGSQPLSTGAVLRRSDVDITQCFVQICSPCGLPSH